MADTHVHPSSPWGKFRVMSVVRAMGTEQLQPHPSCPDYLASYINHNAVSGTFSIFLHLVVTEVLFGVNRSRELTDVQNKRGQKALGGK